MFQKFQDCNFGHTLHRSMYERDVNILVEPVKPRLSRFARTNVARIVLCRIESSRSSTRNQFLIQFRNSKSFVRFWFFVSDNSLFIVYLPLQISSKVRPKKLQSKIYMYDNWWMTSLPHSSKIPQWKVMEIPFVFLNRKSCSNACVHKK